MKAKPNVKTKLMIEERNEEKTISNTKNSSFEYTKCVSFKHI